MKKEFVYFFKANGLNPIKIGKTSGENVAQRISNLKISCPYGGELLGYIECENGIELERKLHLRFEKYWISGEWFDINPAMVQMVISEYSKNENELMLKIKAWIDNGGDKNFLINVIQKNSEKLVLHKEILDFIQEIGEENMDHIPVGMFVSKLKDAKPTFTELTKVRIGLELSKLGYYSKSKRMGSKIIRVYSRK